MAVTVATFRERFPEFVETAEDVDDPLLNPEATVAFSDAVIEEQIEVAKTIYTLSDIAIEYLTAHLLVEDKAHEALIFDRGAGEEMSKGRDNSSYKAIAETGEESFYSTTKYGRRFLALRRADSRRAMPIVF